MLTERGDGLSDYGARRGSGFWVQAHLHTFRSAFRKMAENTDHMVRPVRFMLAGGDGSHGTECIAHQAKQED
jgi:hypothetical protein